jgi:hypothetical protein
MDAMNTGTYEIPVGTGKRAWIIRYQWSEGTKATSDEPPTPGRLESYSIWYRTWADLEIDMDDAISEVQTLVGMDFGRVFDAIYAKEEAR